MIEVDGCAETVLSRNPLRRSVWWDWRFLKRVHVRDHAKGCGVLLGSALQLLSLRFWLCEQIHIQVRDPPISQFFLEQKENRCFFSLETSQKMNLFPFVSCRIHDADHEDHEGSEGNEKSCHFYDLQQENHDSSGSLKDAEPDRTPENSETGIYRSFDRDEGDSVPVETSSSKYQFSFANNISGFVEEPKVLSFTVQELFLGSADSTNFNTCNFSEEVLRSPEEDEDSVGETGSVGVSGVANTQEEVENKRGDFSDHEIAEKAEAISSQDELVSEEEVSDKGSILSEASAPKIDLELVSVDSDDGFLMSSDKIGSFTNVAVSEAVDKVDSCTEKGFLSESFWAIDEGIVEEVEEKPNSEGSCRWDDELAEPEVSSSIEDQLDRSDDDEDDDYNDGFIEMEVQEAIFSVENSIGAKEECWQEKMEHRERGKAEFEGQDDLDSMWEHDEIIEQLKLELKTARTGGLPTILEESESEKESDSSPRKMADDLMKPLKIADQKLEHKDRVMEIQKVYKSYAERMRKLDVLNYQTMHAIGTC